MRIAIHDYAGHPFQLQLSRELARRGHVIRHFYFGGDAGPKGATTRSDADPDTFSIEPIQIKKPYSKGSLVQRLVQDVEYGQAAEKAIGAFAPELVVSSNTPLFAQGPIQAAADRLDAPFVFWVQDIFSVAVDRVLGAKLFGAGRLAASVFKRMEAAQLARSDEIILISEDFQREIAALGVPSREFHTIPNWGAIADIPLRPKTNDWAAAHGLADKFVFLYSGTLGFKHDPGLLLDLADHFANVPDVRIVVASSGVSADWLRERCQAEPRPNLVLMDLQPMEVFPDMLGAADVVLGLLEKDAGEFSVPSKVLSYLCAGRPILLSAPKVNLAARTVVGAGAGLVTEAGERAEFLAAAAALAGDVDLRTRSAAAGRRYAETHFDIDAITRRFEGVFMQAAERREAAAAARVRAA